MAKDTLKALILVSLIILWLPSGIGDLILVPFIISKIGVTMYIFISLIMIFYLYHSISGKGITNKLNNIKKDINGLFRGG